MKATRILIALSVLVSGACNFDIAPLWGAGT